MTDRQVDEFFLDFIVKKFESDSGLKDLVGVTKPLISTGQKEYSINDLVDEMRRGTRIGKRLYTALYGIHENEFNDYLASKKPSLDE
ncbi:MAG: hypothetical protein AABX24_01065 [Nanoarchaeota archaeon]